jgi:hypothetical protein
MSNINYVLVDDSAISIGGTELSLMAILEDRINKVISIKSSELSPSHIDQFKDKIWIIGNCVDLYNNKEFFAILEKLKLVSFVKIEFDYNFCLYRGEYPHEKFAKQPCSCPYGLGSHNHCSSLYDVIQEYSKHIFFMSEKQRAIYSTHIPQMHFNKTSILSSCFTKESLSKLEELRSSPKNNKSAILAGYGGWHSEAKGKEVAKEFCLSNNIPFDILPTQNYYDHLKLLSTYSSLVFLPIIHDTCPRCIIEAKLMELEVITNFNSQHITEFWWQDIDSIKDYISSRPAYFWSVIDKI